jgi:NAD+-dependent protein deacetylase SIR2
VWFEGLEETAGVPPQRIAYVHGSLKYATCEMCRRKVHAADFEDDIRAGRVARCRRHNKTTMTTTPTRIGTRTSARKKRARDPDHNTSNNCMPSNVCGGVLKPGVTFFGEALQDSIKTKLEADREKVDALIVIGTSLSVYVCCPPSLPGCPFATEWLTVFIVANVQQQRSHFQSN